MRTSQDRCRTYLAVVVLLSAASAACPQEPDPGPGGTFTFIYAGPTEQLGAIRVDVIVMVDSSGSMSQEQLALTQSFPRLIEELIDPSDADGDTRPDHPPVEDLNIAVISSDMGTAGYSVSTCANRDVGDNGCFRSTPSPTVTGCAATYPAFLSRNETNADAYDATRMAQDFTCLATLGTTGCGFEQQLKAMLAATTTNPTTGTCNTGFFRDDAVLALVFVTDEEDCSVQPDHAEMFDQGATYLGHLGIRCFLHPDYLVPVADYASAFRSLKPAEDADKIVLGMIVGVPPDAPECIGDGDDMEACLGIPAMTEQIDPAAPVMIIPSCNTSMGMAFPPRRFVRLAQEFGDNAVVDSICKPDWTDAIARLTRKLVERLPRRCLPRALPFDEIDDDDALAPDLCLANCMVVEHYGSDRPCATDPSCPPESCPPATVGQAYEPPPCANPVTGAACTPLKRDLGTVEARDGSPRRACLLRQSHRPWDGGACGAPTDPGWTYLPGSPSGGVPSCPTLDLLGPSGESLVEDGSTISIDCVEVR